jgi:hypothetical protein
MNMHSHRAPKRLLPVLLCCLALAFAACVPKSPDSDVARQPSKSGEQLLAYGVSVVVPPSWNITGKMAPEAASKASLDSRRQNGERIALIETVGPAGSRGVESLLVAFLVSEQDIFMPRAHAETIPQEDLNRLAKDLVQREHASAKKMRTQSGVIDVQLSRQTINGNLAIVQHMLIMGPDAKPVLLLNWDIYLPNGAGLNVRTVSDPDNSGSEVQIIGIVNTLRVE